MVAILTMALGIGATSAMFSVINGVVLGISIVTVIVFGLAPAWQAARADVASIIKGCSPI